jgi:hypothetical protein
MRIFLSVLILAIYPLTGFAQRSKIDASLSDHHITLQPDAKWRRVTFTELDKFYTEMNVNLDSFLRRQPFVAAFYYIPVDSPRTAPVTTEFTIEVYRIKDSVRGTSIPGARDTIQTNKPFLDRMLYPTYYYDQITQSYIVKFKAKLAGKNIDWNNPPEYYGIEQIKQTGENVVVVRYHCALAQECIYFHLFEKMISSFR